jgi:nucleotide-binding universal stress UspA family protein
MMVLRTTMRRHKTLEPEEQTVSRPIIVGVALRDDDRAPLALARAFADLTGAPIALAVTYPYGGSTLFVTPESVTGVHEAAEHGLKRLADSLGDGIDVSTHVRSETSPAFALHNLAVEIDAAAIVVGSTHRGRIGRVLAGDIGANLLHGAPCPVAIRGAAAPGRVRWDHAPNRGLSRPHPGAARHARPRHHASGRHHDASRAATGADWIAPGPLRWGELV